MQGRTKPLSLLSATTLGCTLALGAPLALPQVGTFTAAQAQENQVGTQAGTESRSYVNYEGDYVIAGVHTEMLNAFLDGNQFTLATLADTGPGQQGRFNPARTVFHLPDVEDAHTKVVAGYDYIAPEDTDIFYIPSTRTRGLLYPGSLHRIRPRQPARLQHQRQARTAHHYLWRSRAPQLGIHPQGYLPADLPRHRNPCRRHPGQLRGDLHHRCGH